MENKATDLTPEFITSLKMAAVRTNSYAGQEDIKRNHTNYGQMTAYIKVLEQLGHKITITCWEVDDTMVIGEIVIDGEKTTL